MHDSHGKIHIILFLPIIEQYFPSLVTMGPPLSPWHASFPELAAQIMLEVMSPAEQAVSEPEHRELVMVFTLTWEDEGQPSFKKCQKFSFSLSPTSDYRKCRQSKLRPSLNPMSIICCSLATSAPDWRTFVIKQVIK